MFPKCIISKISRLRRATLPAMFNLYSARAPPTGHSIILRYLTIRSCSQKKIDSKEPFFTQPTPSTLHTTITTVSPSRPLYQSTTRHMIDIFCFTASHRLSLGTCMPHHQITSWGILPLRSRDLLSVIDIYDATFSNTATVANTSVETVHTAKRLCSKDR